MSANLSVSLRVNLMDAFQLTDRQKDLLKAVVELYVKEGEPVGSENVEKAYNLGVSPATIRNEMVRLTEMGFLKQPHTSAGRIPTSMGFRVYISELMKEKQLPISAEVSIKENLWQSRYQQNRLLKEAVRALAGRPNAAGARRAGRNRHAACLSTAE